jgi:preprotein translocase subunit YajC
MGKSKNVGSLGWGDSRVSIVLTIIIIFFVGYMIFSHREAKREKASTQTYN